MSRRAVFPTQNENLLWESCCKRSWIHWYDRLIVKEYKENKLPV